MPEAYITGTIQSGEGFGARSAYCRWRLISGPEWTLLEGASKGHTQSAAAEAVDGRHEFAHPVDAHYSCTSLVGWPQLLVTVWQTDDLDRHEIAGYGIARVPPAPGVHLFEVVCWRPEGSWYQELAAIFRGGLPQLTDTSVLFDASRRHVLGTVTTGSVLVELQVMLRGFTEHGVEFAGPAAAAAPGAVGGGEGGLVGSAI